MPSSSARNESMFQTASLRRHLVLFLALFAFLTALSAGSTTQAAEDPYDGDWHFTVMPYLWLPTVNGTVSLEPPPGATGSPSFDFSASPWQLLSKLKFAFMSTGEVRKGNWSLFTDFIALKLAGKNTTVRTITGPGGIVEVPIDVGTQFGLKELVWTFAPSYTVYRSLSTSLDLFAGFRDLQAKPSLQWRFAGPLGLFPQTGSTEQAIVVWAGLVGAKGRIAISGDGRWFVPYYADIGLGAKAFTWQTILGVGYAFNWGDLGLDYRTLYYSAEREGAPLSHLTMHGPELTVSFHF